MSPTRVRSIAGALAALAIFLAAGEFGVRRWLLMPTSSRVDPRFGRVQEAHARVVQSREGWSAMVTNAFGFFGHEVAARRPRVRALLVGDSFAEGLQLPMEKRFGDVAEREMPGLEVVNVAQSGRLPLQYAAYMPEYQRTFEPDVVVIQLNDGDLSELDDAQRLAEVREEIAGRGPREEQRPGPGASLAARLHWEIRKSALMKYANQRVELLLEQERARFGAKFGGRKGPVEDVVKRPVSVRAAALLDSVTDAITGVNPNVIVVYVPHVEYFAPSPHVAYPARRAFYRAFAARHGLDLVDPSDALLESFRRDGQPLHGFMNTRLGEGHLNARGHAIVGRLLAAAIARRFPPGGPPPLASAAGSAPADSSAPAGARR